MVSLAVVRPVNLSLLARKGSKPQIRFTRAARAQLRDAVAEVVGSARVAPRLDHVEQPCGGQGGEALQRLGDECHVGVELRGTSLALTFALHPCLAQHPLDGGVMDPELGGDGPYPPVLDEVVAQDLRLELVVGRHRARRSVPGATPSASSYRRATPLPTDELADRARAEVAVHLGSAARCASSLGGRFGRHRRIGLAHRNSMRGEFSIARGASGTVMRHFVRTRAFAAPAPVAALALGMTVPAASRVLIPASRPAQRFTPSEAAAARPAVLLAPVTARADEHLAPASGTEKQSGIVHCSPWRGGLDDPRSPGNTALGAVRKCGSGRSLGRDRQVSTVRGCVCLLADSDLTPTHQRRHRRYARRAPPLAGSIGSGGKQRHVPQAGAVGRFSAGSLRPAQSVHEGCSPNNRAFSQPPTTSGAERCSGSKSGNSGRIWKPYVRSQSGSLRSRSFPR